VATRVAVDIGGTFTDLVHLDEGTGDVGLAKAATTPSAFEEGVLEAVEQTELSGVGFLAHGTTVVINALTERKGARVGLITTQGFRDVLEIAKGNRPDLYNFVFRKPTAFVPRHLRFEVGERIDYHGRVTQPLEESDVRDAIRAIRDEGAEAVAICLLHSYANPAHERRIAEIVSEEWPAAPVSVSHELSGEWREYDRTSTTVLDAYVKPTVRQYLTRLSERLDDGGIGKDTHFAMQSNGGLSRFAVAAEVPINLVESGPVGGIIGAAVVGKAIDRPNLITFDVGGTTAKSSLIEGGEVRLTADYHFDRDPRNAGYPLKVPVVDIIEIGMAGGSIAWIDPAGSLKVGPHSAVADPGPACYGRGGTEATLTDANLVTNRIGAAAFMGGRMPLDEGLAEAAIGRLGERLGTDVADTARGILRIANASMVHLLRLVSVRRGRDPREFALVACGGGGPLHGAMLAAELKVPEVIVPTAPGHFSALGMLMSDIRHDLVRTSLMRLDAPEAPERTGAIWAELEELMTATFASEHVAADDVRLVRQADMRYQGQEHTVTVPIPDGPLDEGNTAEVRRRFDDAHERLYTFRLDVPAELVTFRLTGYGTVPKPPLREMAPGGDGAAARTGSRMIDFDERGRAEAAVFDRGALGPGAEIDGPAAIEETATTTLVPPGMSATVDRYGNVIVRTGA
jgi:N-methylhydantoinase A